MSKIGKKSIDISKVRADIVGNKITMKNAQETVVVEVPDLLKVSVKDKKLYLEPAIDLKTADHVVIRDVKRAWGLYRALISNHVAGLIKPFESELHINGLGFKAALANRSLTFTLGYSHKIDFVLPQGVSVDVDKTGQRLVVKSASKELVGKVCSDIKVLRAPEPYKGTGIKLAQEVILRKAGKTKAA